MEISFSDVITSIIVMLFAAFATVLSILVVVYGAPLVWRFIKRFNTGKGY